MGPIAAVITGLKKLSDFEGRASRSEFWWMWAATLAGVTGLQLVIATPFFAMVFQESDNDDATTAQDIVLSDAESALLLVFVLLSSFLVTLLMLSVTARRFVDCNRPLGWFKTAARMNSAVAVFALIVLSLALMGFASLAVKIGIFSLLLAFPSYVSVIWTFWIGFIKTKHNPQSHLPNPNEALS
jgi:uncharacterized membrane protein YhaH (DUF805 family)